MSEPNYEDREVQERAKEYLEQLGYPENSFHLDKIKLTSFGKSLFADRFSQNEPYSDEIAAVVALTDWDSFKGGYEPSPVYSWYPDWKVQVNELFDTLDLKYQYIDLLDSCRSKANTIDSTCIQDKAVRRHDTGGRTISMTGQLQDGRWFSLSVEYENDQDVSCMLEPYFPNEGEENDE